MKNMEYQVCEKCGKGKYISKTLMDHLHGRLNCDHCGYGVATLRGDVMEMKKKKLDYIVEPIGERVLVRRDESKQVTKGGIVLPDTAEIPTIKGRIIAISTKVENDPDYPIKQYDKVLFHPRRAVPVDFDPDNVQYVVPVQDILAIFRKDDEK